MDNDGSDLTEIADIEDSDATGPSWLAEQSDLLTLEEGFDRALLSGPYIFIKRGEDAA